MNHSSPLSRPGARSSSPESPSTRPTGGIDSMARARANRLRRQERAAEQSFTAYADTVHRVAYRFAFKRFGGNQAADIAQATVTKLWADHERYMAAYPDPKAFAIAVARTTGIDLQRRERAQRGEGANLRAGADGQLDVRRIVLSSEEITDLRPDADIAERVAAGLDLGAVLDRLDPLDRLLLEMRFLDDYRVGEIAQMLHMVSSTVSRRIARACTLIDEFIVPR